MRSSLRIGSKSSWSRAVFARGKTSAAEIERITHARVTAGAVVVDLLFVEVDLGDRVFEGARDLLTVFLYPEPHGPRRFVRLAGHGFEVPVLDLEDGHAHARVQKDEVGAQAVQVGLDIQLPAGRQVAQQVPKARRLAAVQGRVESTELRERRRDHPRRVPPATERLGHLGKIVFLGGDACQVGALVRAGLSRELREEEWAPTLEAPARRCPRRRAARPARSGWRARCARGRRW